MLDFDDDVDDLFAAVLLPLEVFAAVVFAADAFAPEALVLEVFAPDALPAGDFAADVAEESEVDFVPPDRVTARLTPSVTTVPRSPMRSAA